MKIRDGKSEWILRQVLYQYVTKQLIERPKVGFAIPLGDWLRGFRIMATDCGEGVRDILMDGRLGTIVPVCDVDALARAIEKELDSPQAPEMQLAGGNRELPKVVLEQFLLATGR